MGFSVTSGSLDDCAGDAIAIPKNGAVVIVCSTYNGTPADNAGAFDASLEDV